MGSWFSKCLPRIKDINDHLKETIQNLNKIKGVKGIYVWGSYAQNIANPNFRVKDVDVLIKTNFNSGDLLALDNNIVQCAMTDEEFENQGYDPYAIYFSKKFADIQNIEIDRWAISSDRKLLHWGPIMADEVDTNFFIKEAEKHACCGVGISQEDLQKSSEAIRKNWYGKYSEYLKECFNGMPSGWYKVDNIKIKEILKKTIIL